MVCMPRRFRTGERGGGGGFPSGGSPGHSSAGGASVYLEVCTFSMDVLWTTFARIRMRQGVAFVVYTSCGGGTGMGCGVATQA